MMTDLVTAADSPARADHRSLDVDCGARSSSTTAITATLKTSTARPHLTVYPVIDSRTGPVSTTASPASAQNLA
jgi:hypothetical protein